MRRVRYAVAMSLDGYLAGPKGEADWITPDPEIDFHALFKQFDTALIGRRTFEAMASRGGTLPGMKTFVFSRTLRPSDCPKATLVADQAEAVVADLRSRPGKDIWLFGGGELFRSLAAARLVDTVEVSIIPIMLGEGIPVLPPPAQRVKLKWTSHKVYQTGIIALEYALP
jgi:dihydrofolate reductase